MAASPLQTWLADQVRAGLADRGWTQGHLAERADLSEKHLSQMMTGRSSGTVAAWDRLLALVDRTPGRIRQRTPGRRAEDHRP